MPQYFHSAQGRYRAQGLGMHSGFLLTSQCTSAQRLSAAGELIACFSWFQESVFFSRSVIESVLSKRVGWLLTSIRIILLKSDEDYCNCVSIVAIGFSWRSAGSTLFLCKEIKIFPGTLLYHRLTRCCGYLKNISRWPHFLTRSR